MVIQEYQDPRVRKYLRYGYWYMERKGTIDRAIRLCLVLIVAAIWIVAMFQIYGYTQESANSDAVARDLAIMRLPIEQLHATRSPELPIVSAAAVLAGRDAQTADFVAWAENPNPDWYAEIEYVFSWTGGGTLPASAFILPQSKSALISQGITVNFLPENVQISITPKKWLRLTDKETLARLADFQDKIVVSEAQSSREAGLTTVVYTVQNNTIYDLLTPRFAVVLTQDQTPVAVGINEINILPSLGRETLELRWLQTLPENLAVEIYPQINVLDQSGYHLPAGGETKF